MKEKQDCCHYFFLLPPQVMLWAERKRTVPIVREDEDEEPHLDEHDEGE